MSVRMRHTRSHTRNRRSHHALTGEAVVTDKETGNLRLPHRLDETTGMYRGKQIVPKKEVKAERVKREKRIKEHHETDEHLEGVKEPLHTEKHQDEVRDLAASKGAKKPGLIGRMTKGGKAKSRSGLGGGA